MLGRRTPGGDEPVEDGDRLIGVDAPAALNGSASRVCSSTMQELQEPSVGGLVELEVERPDLVGMLGMQALGRHGGLADALALSPPLGDPQALLAPQASDALAV